MELDCIDIHGMAFDSVIGAYPSERLADQRVLLDVSLFLNTRPAVMGDLARTVDYARLRGELQFLMHACRFQLLETAAEALCRFILSAPVDDRAQVERVSVKLGKPAVLASLRVTRDASEYVAQEHQADYGTRETLFETRDLGVYRLRLNKAATNEWPDTHLLSLGGDLQVQGCTLPAGSALHIPAGSVVALSGQGGAIVVARPRFAIAESRGASSPLGEPLSYYPAEHALPHATPADAWR